MHSSDETIHLQRWQKALSLEERREIAKRKKSLPKPDDFDPLYAELHYIYADYEDETVTGGMGDDWRVNFTRTDNNKRTVRNIVTNEVIEIYDWEFFNMMTGLLGIERGGPHVADLYSDINEYWADFTSRMDIIFPDYVEYWGDEGFK